MPRPDILARLEIDPGYRTLGELLQDRAAAVHEIRRPRADIERLRAIRSPGRRPADGDGATPNDQPFRPGMLITLKQVCEMIGVCRSTIYRWVAEGSFPAAVCISKYAVRWRTEDIDCWRDALTQ